VDNLEKSSVRIGGVVGQLKVDKEENDKFKEFIKSRY